MRIRLDNALLYDGTGSAPFPGSLLVEGERIAAVSRSGADKPEADRTLDLRGLALSPGFIDSHGHSDLILFEQPLLQAKLRQGITTEIMGQDGLSLAPLPPARKEAWRKRLAPLAGVSDAIDWNHGSTDGYLNLLQQRGTGLNVCYLVPHGNLRLFLDDPDCARVSDSELERLCAVLREELRAGGFGLSTGLLYAPCANADARELTALCATAASLGRPFVVHQRSEADDILNSMREVLEIGRASGVHLHFSHFKVCGGYNAPKFPRMLDMIDEARAEGLTVTFDLYPYAYGSTVFSSLLPPWAHAGSTRAMLDRLRDPATRARMLRDIRTSPCAWDNFVAFAGLEGIYVSYAGSGRNQNAIGKNLRQLGELRGKDPVEAALDLILEEEDAVGMVDFYGREEQVEALLRRPEMCFSTDGLMPGTPHPRTFGASARLLGHYVRERRVLSLEAALRAMTLQAAETFGIRERGALREGWYADLVAFNPDTVRDTATFTNPRQHPEGIELVMVNGHIAHIAAGLPGKAPASATPHGLVLRGPHTEPSDAVDHSTPNNRQGAQHMDSARINALSQKYLPEMTRFLRDMIAIPSESCGEEGVIKRIEREMRKVGYDRVEIDNMGNVIGYLGNGPRLIAFDAHIDTVGLGERANWTFDPYQGYEDDETIGGRGASDQEGGMASMVYGGLIMKELGLIPEGFTVAMVGTVQEEDCDGLCWQYIIREDGLKPEFVVSTEPTDGGIYRGQRGRMEIRLDVRGVSCHGSAPERGDNAIFNMGHILIELEELHNRLRDDAFLGKGSLTVSQIFYSSPSRCAVADGCSISIDRRLTHGEDKDLALNQIRELPSVKKLGDKARVSMYTYEVPSWTGLTYPTDCYFPTWVLPEDHVVCTATEQAYRELFGTEPRTDKWTFSTNGVSIMGMFGIPVVGFGPGKEKEAHAPNEKTWKADLVRCAALYAALPGVYAARKG